MAQFVVLSEDGTKVFLRTCVRIAKKSLIFAHPIEGKTQIPKHRCYYYDDTKEEMFHFMSEVCTKEEIAKYLTEKFTQVAVKSTRF